MTIKKLADGYFAGDGKWRDEQHEQDTKDGWVHGFTYAMNQWDSVTLADIGYELRSIYIPSGYEIDFQIGQIVYLKTDIEQLARMVTGITLKPNKGVTYWLSLGGEETCHYAIEISSERDIVKAAIG